MPGPGYSGYFLKGLAGGLQSGISMGTQLTQLKWQKQKKKEIDDLNIKLSDTWNTIGQEIVSLANDGQLSDDDKLKIYAMTMAAPYEMQSVMQNIRSSLSQFKTKDLENQMEYVKTFYEYAQGLDPKDIGSIYESVRNYITDPHAKTLFEVCDKKLRHEYEVEKAEPIPEVFTSAEALREKYPEAGVRYTDEGYVPTFGEITEPKAPGITDYNSAANYLSKFKNSPPDTFNRIKAGFQSQFPNIDMSSITQESLREPEKPIPEGEITAGEKRTYDMASSIIFGSSDWVTGISKPGIISTMISNKLNMGQTLTEEEKAEVRNNYNLIKDTLPGEVISMVESQLRRYGIPLETPTPEPTITPEPEPKKWWEFWKGETTPTKPTTPTTPEVTPKAGEIPTPKVPAGEKEAMIPMMTKKELEDAIRGLDPSDPMYKLLYDEAVKRGYITK